jgi:electron transfer flavoprotein alpha/beta subunit
MAAKKKEIKTLGLGDLGIDAAAVREAAARFRTVRLATPPKGKGAEMVQGAPDVVAREIVRRIREKTGVI